VVLAGLAIRLAVGASVHLTEDEAYYRLWAQAPALGYYDHPPMVAWWIWLGERLAGDTPLGVRLLPALSCALTSLLVYDLCRQGGGAPAEARRATLWFNAMPLVVAGGFLGVPDAPAALFWTLSLWAALRAVGGRSVRWWLVAGAAAGLAALSKYSSLFLGPGLLLWLAATDRGRGALRTPGPWIALGLAGALFGLNVGWNQTHHWLTFAKQFGRIAPHGFAPRYLLEFALTQFLLLNPLLAIFLARGRRFAPFALSALPFIAYLVVHSLHDRIQAHWPAPVYPTLATLAATAASGLGGRWARLRELTPLVGFGMTAAVALYAAAPLVGVPLSLDPALPIRGWPDFAGRVEALRRGAGAGWIATTSYGLAAQLSDEPAIGAPVIQISERDRWSGLRTGVQADTRRIGLLVELPRRVDLDRLRRCFATVRSLGAIGRGDVGGATKRYEAMLLSGSRRDVLRDGCADSRVQGGAAQASSEASPASDSLRG